MEHESMKAYTHIGSVLSVNRGAARARTLPLQTSFYLNQWHQRPLKTAPGQLLLNSLPY